MDRVQFKELLTLAIEEMIRCDTARNPIRTLLDSAERNITAHLRNHLERALAQYPDYKCYQVDHEYNRMGKGEVSKHYGKKKGSERPKCDPKIGNFIPDIAIHRRGVQACDDRNANLLVVEVKKIDAFDGYPKRVRRKKAKCALFKDLFKLEALKDPDGDFQYRHTASLVFSGKRVWAAIDGARVHDLLIL